jgi:hypothetical protein
MFRKMTAEGKTSKAPLKEAFGNWRNVRLVLVALFGLVAGQAVIWYTGQFYTLFFLTQTLKVDSVTANLLVAGALVIGTPMLVASGTLPDRIGRKPIMMAGFLLSALLFIPLFKTLTHYANPALEMAQARSPVTVVADPQRCSFQFNPVGTAEFTRSCDIAKSFLAKASVTYANEAAPPGSVAIVRVGAAEIRSFEGALLGKAEALAAHNEFSKAVGAAIRAAGYPSKADPAQINYPMVIATLAVFMSLVAMVYGPIAATLVEMFPTRIRYSAMSLPYHIGNGWFGGFMPTMAFALVATTGDMYAGIWYPIVFAAIAFVVSALFLRETKDDVIDA